jgi:hypothetical protein
VAAMPVELVTARATRVSDRWLIDQVGDTRIAVVVAHVADTTGAVNSDLASRHRSRGHARLNVHIYWYW